jgi:uncharacterized damage-inducible protein DinB
MAETPQQYQQRMIDSLDGQDAKKVQAATADRLARLIRGKSRPSLSRRPAPGKWSVNEILAHLAEAEIVIGYRMRSIVGSPGGPLQGYDQDKWAAEGNYGKRDARKSLAQFRALREANLDYLRGLSAEQLKRHGMHSERGEETLEFMVRMIAGHDVNHTRQIEAILRPRR